jgi:hypothetical protein
MPASNLWPSVPRKPPTATGIAQVAIRARPCVGRARAQGWPRRLKTRSAATHEATLARMQTAAPLDLGAGGRPSGGRRVIPARTGRPGLPAAAQGAYRAVPWANRSPPCCHGRVVSRVSLAAAFGLSRRPSASRRYAAGAAGDATVGSDARDQGATCCPCVFGCWPVLRRIRPLARSKPANAYRDGLG